MHVSMYVGMYIHRYVNTYVFICTYINTDICTYGSLCLTLKLNKLSTERVSPRKIYI